MLRRFLAFGGLERAGSLAYVTLLSLVPLMTVVLGVLSVFPVGDAVSERLQAFVFKNFVPAAGEVIHRYLNEFTAKASHLGGVGLLVLVVVAVLLVHSIDKTFNTIWEVRRRRRPLNRFLVYWAVLSLGPLLLGVSLLLTSRLVDLPWLARAAGGGPGHWVVDLLPVVTAALGFGLLYWLVPNRPVKAWHALVGGVFAAVLFELSKRAFTWYVTSFPAYEFIYGALAAVPIFLVWLYLSWVVVLLGAEVTYGLEAHAHLFAGKGRPAGEFEQLVRLALRLARAQRQGRAVSERELIRCCPRAEQLLARMQKAGLVESTDRDQWLLARSAERLDLLDLYLTCEKRLPAPGEPGWPADRRLAKRLETLWKQLRTQLGVSLAELVEEEVSPESDNIPKAAQGSKS